MEDKKKSFTVTVFIIVGIATSALYVSYPFFIEDVEDYYLDKHKKIESQVELLEQSYASKADSFNHSISDLVRKLCVESVEKKFNDYYDCNLLTAYHFQVCEDLSERGASFKFVMILCNNCKSKSWVSELIEGKISAHKNTCTSLLHLKKSHLVKLENQYQELVVIKDEITYLQYAKTKAKEMAYFIDDLGDYWHPIDLVYDLAY